MQIIKFIEKLQSRLNDQQRFMDCGGSRTYDQAGDGGFNEAVWAEIEFLRDLLKEVDNLDV